MVEKSPIISEGDLPTTDIIEPRFNLGGVLFMV